MSRTLHSTLLHAALLAAIASSAHAAEFVYQGQLDDRGVPANGRYDLRIAAYGDEKSAAGLMAPIEFPAVEVKDGRFELRFDAPLAKAREAWLEVSVRDVGAGNFATIPGRSKAISAPLIGACWSSTGDSGSNAATNFLGTTDVQSLVLRTGNAQSLRIEPSGILVGGLPITANVIAGSSANGVVADVRGATIAGGGVPTGDSDPNFGSDAPNRVTDHYGSVGGGFANQAGDDTGTVQDRSMATVAGGWRNRATGGQAAIGGGYNNLASGQVSTIAGGNVSRATGEYAAVAGGAYNAAEGPSAFVAGGSFNCAGAAHSLAAGYRAKVRPPTDPGTGACASLGSYPGGDGDQGTFVWADSQPASLPSTGPNQFLVRASGGIWFGSNSLALIPAGRFLNTSTGGYLSSAGVWTDSSSRAVKTAFEAIDPGSVLGRVLALPIREWSYRAAPDVRHVGPVAEDFHAAFGLGEGDTHLASLDTAGVALAAIQGLNAKLEAENAALREELVALRSLVESRLNAEH
ncbi:MAG: hypothetical protein IPG63_00290 [Xanthomonadales bacterium]|nr:hypothetical protein [Xanthomonadales bacterium]